MNESITDSLVGPLFVVMSDVLVEEPAKMLLTERDEVAQTLAANGANEAPGVSIEVRTLRGKANDLDVGVTNHVPEGLVENGVTVHCEQASENDPLTGIEI